jgi:hypothetical protein
MHYYRVYRPVPLRKYGLSNFVGDTVLCFATGGVWFIWICIRELNNR